MWTYIARRLFVMIPTLFGVTVVSFVIMQLAPGDPVQSQLGSGGSLGVSSQNREAYLIQKRDLKLDKPLLLNYRYFLDYSPQVALAARWRAISPQELADEAAAMAADPAAHAVEIRFLRSLKPRDFATRFRPPNLSDEQLAVSGLTRQEWEAKIRERRLGLAEAVQGLLVPWCEDVGIHGVAGAIALLRDPATPKTIKAGATQCLTSMVPTPFVYTLSREAEPGDEARLGATWRQLWKNESQKFPPLDPDRAKVLAAKLAELAALTRAEMFEQIQGSDFSADDVPFFVGVILGDAPRAKKAIAAEFAKLYVSARINLEVAPTASDAAVQSVADSWIAHYDASREQYVPSVPAKLGYLFVDTQYAHMVWRLVTFRFGRSYIPRPSRGLSRRIPSCEGFAASAPIGRA